MKNTIQHPIYGQITYEESFWTGKKTITIGDNRLQNAQKNSFYWIVGETSELVIVTGNAMLGVSLTIRGEIIWVYPKTPWYDWLLAFLPMVLIMFWGNSAALSSIIPVVGGAIGGGICGGAAVTGMYLFHGKRLWQKLLIALTTAVITFIICAVLGFAILSTLS